MPSTPAAVTGWTITLKVVAAAKKKGGDQGGGGGFAKGGGAAGQFEKLYHEPAKRDLRGYILPSDQPDFPTATKYINTLLGNGVKIRILSPPRPVRRYTDLRP